MPIEEAQLLQWIGISTVGRRNTIIDDFMPDPEGLSLMKDVSESDLKEANSIYAKRATNSFTLGRIHLKRLFSLALWVRDKFRIDEEPSFEDGTTRDGFLNEIEQAYERDERRKELKKVGEALIGKSFQIKLKGQSQWKRWTLELDSILNSIVGVDGVPIRYVIRKHRNPDPETRYSTWEDMAIAYAPLTGPNFKQDARTVHQIILANIHEDSDAYTYIKMDLPKENGRRDIQNLRQRYESHATQQATINEAKQVLATLRYKHPRAMRFETFSAKLQRALDDLEECGRPEDNGNVVDDLWDRIQDQDSNYLFYLRAKGSTIYLNTWSPTASDLEEFPKVFLTSDTPWDPEKVEFPSMSDYKIDALETEVNVSTVRASIGGIDDVDRLRRNIMALESKSLVPGPLEEAAVAPARNFLSSERHTNVNSDDLSELWGISKEQAEMTLRTTTQYHVRSATMPLFRRYRTDRMFNAPRLRTVMATDTMDLRGESLDGNKFCQVFGNRLMFADARPIRTKGECHEALKGFISEYGAPDLMIMDGSQEQTAPGSKFQAILRKYQIPVQRTHPQRPNQNPAETIIRELRKRWYRTVFRTNCPRVLWNYALPHIAKLMQLTASNAAELKGRTPLEVMTGDTPDISEYLDFAFYDRVWYKDNAGLSVPKPGRFLGVAHRVGHLMSYWVLPASGRPIAQTTVSRVTTVELTSDQHKSTFEKFDRAIAEKFKEGRLFKEPEQTPDLDDWHDLLNSDEDFAAEFAKVYNNADVPEADEEFTPDSFDSYLQMEVALDRGQDHPQLARVTKRLRDANGLPIGTAHDNPILDTRLYEVEFLDGHRQALTANQIATSMFAQVDEEGRRQLLFDSIIDVRSDSSAIKKADAFIISKKRTSAVVRQPEDGVSLYSGKTEVQLGTP